MSTILKALKRAEQDCPDPGDTDRSSLKLNVRTTLNSKLKGQGSGFPIRPIYLVITLCLTFVITAAAYVLVFKDTAVQPQRPARKTASPAPVAAPADLTGHTQPVLPPRAKAPALPVPDTRHRHPLEKPPELPEIEKKTAPITSQPPAAPLGTPDVPPDRIDDPPALPDIRPLAQGILKLQALSWAETSSGRVVVINNRVLGEGESVEGYRIQRIEKDGVILQQSGQAYTLGFKYR
jgi:hypothetical protein